MNEFEIVTVINRPVEEVLTALQDLDEAPQWNPGLTEVRQTSKRTARRRQHDGLRRQVPRAQLRVARGVHRVHREPAVALLRRRAEPRLDHSIYAVARLIVPRVPGTARAADREASAESS